MTVDPVLLGFAGVFGAILGSFLNVCIVRLPAEESVIRPASRCPACDARIAWYDNIPLLSWVALGGRCRRCRAGISLQYPAVELAVGLVWAGALWHYGASMEALKGAAFGTLLLGIAVTDARTYLIPDEYTWGGLALGMLLSLAGGVPGVVQAALGAAVGFGILYGVAWLGEKVFGKEAMGGGDIKMMAMVGSFVGWEGVLLTIFGGALLGTVIFVPVWLAARLLRGKELLVPFGVFLAAAAAVTFVFGNAIVGWYVSYLLG